MEEWVEPPLISLNPTKLMFLCFSFGSAVVLCSSEEKTINL